MDNRKLKIMVLAGGPDREHDVSLMSGATVTSALAQAGHEVRQRDIRPDDLSALDEFAAWPGDAIFPMLHGSWGEGGGLQSVLDQRRLRYVGCGHDAAALCMAKHRAKVVLIAHNLPTPPFEMVATGVRRTLKPPVVVKAPYEGSSIDLVICKTDEEIRRARARLRRRHPELLIEKFITGKELTVGVMPAGPQPAPHGELLNGDRALPPIHIIPSTAFYDYSAKYNRDDTQYLFNIDLPASAIAEAKRVAVEAARVLGCRHYCRVDLIIDHEIRPWILEINTIPGFTSHSLFPKAAAHAGISLPKLVDHLVRLALL